MSCYNLLKGKGSAAWDIQTMAKERKSLMSIEAKWHPRCRSDHYSVRQIAQFRKINQRNLPSPPQGNSWIRMANSCIATRVICRWWLSIYIGRQRRDLMCVPSGIPSHSPRLRETAQRICLDFKVPRLRGGSVMRFPSFHIRNPGRFLRRSKAPSPYPQPNRNTRLSRTPWRNKSGSYASWKKSATARTSANKTSSTAITRSRRPCKQPRAPCTNQAHRYSIPLCQELSRGWKDPSGELPDGGDGCGWLNKSSWTLSFVLQLSWNRLVYI